MDYNNLNGILNNLKIDYSNPVFSKNNKLNETLKTSSNNVNQSLNRELNFYGQFENNNTPGINNNMSGIKNNTPRINNNTPRNIPNNQYKKRSRYNFEDHNPQRNNFMVTNKKDLRNTNQKNNYLSNRNDEYLTQYDSRNHYVNPIVDYNTFSENYKQYKQDQRNGFEEDNKKQISHRELVPNVSAVPVFNEME